MLLEKKVGDRVSCNRRGCQSCTRTLGERWFSGYIEEEIPFRLVELWFIFNSVNVSAPAPMGPVKESVTLLIMKFQTFELSIVNTK